METASITTASQTTELSATNIIESIILPHRKSIFNRALQLCRDVDFAEDLVQETILYGIKNFCQLRDQEKCKYWLLAILKNLFLKEVLRNKRLDNREFTNFVDKLVTNKFPEKEILADEIIRELRFIIEGLEERLKILIQLFYFQNLSYKEIADKLDIPIGTVMSRLSRAKIYLKGELLRNELYAN
jgi:RNA polymerase sigma-70 factor (ECF subfamily)